MDQNQCPSTLRQQPNKNIFFPFFLFFSLSFSFEIIIKKRLKITLTGNEMNGDWVGGDGRCQRLIRLKKEEVGI